MRNSSNSAVSQQATKPMSFIEALLYRIVALSIVPVCDYIIELMDNNPDNFMYIFHYWFLTIPSTLVLLLLLVYYFRTKVRKPDLKKLKLVDYGLASGIALILSLLLFLPNYFINYVLVFTHTAGSSGIVLAFLSFIGIRNVTGKFQFSVLFALPMTTFLILIAPPLIIFIYYSLFG